MTPTVAKEGELLGRREYGKRTKVPGTRDAGGKAKGCSSSEPNNIAVRLSISLSNYSKYSINNS